MMIVLPPLIIGDPAIEALYNDPERDPLSGPGVMRFGVA
jgi:hypothetical protein